MTGRTPDEEGTFSRWWLWVLRHGHPDKEPGPAVASFALAAIRHGWTLADYELAMSNPANALAGYYLRRDDRGDQRARHPRHVSRKIRREWKKFTEHAAEHPQVHGHGEARQRAAEVRDAANGVTWSGRTGVRDHTVLCALLDAADRLGHTQPTVSLRTLTEATPYRDRKTITRALDSLASAGWITRIPGGGIDQPTGYAIDIPGEGQDEGVCQKGASTLPFPWGDTAGPFLAQPMAQPVPHNALAMVFTPQAAAVHAVLEAADGVPLTPADVVALAGVSRRTVYRWLPQLALAGLAMQKADGWVVGQADPAQVAKDHGADFLAKLRKRKHENQRKGFREWLGEETPEEAEEGAQRPSPTPSRASSASGAGGRSTIAAGKTFHDPPAVELPGPECWIFMSNPGGDLRHVQQVPRVRRELRYAPGDGASQGAVLPVPASGHPVGRTGAGAAPAGA